MRKIKITKRALKNRIVMIKVGRNQTKRKMEKKIIRILRIQKKKEKTIKTMKSKVQTKVKNKKISDI